jgi:NTP pyrophosphatase (non-canonical NTP hydrolase)
MMTRRQFYLLKLMEECNEVAQRAAKQIQFGIDESQGSKASPSEHKVPGTNGERLRGEIVDLLAVIDILIDINEVPWLAPWELMAEKCAKRQKIDKYLQYSEKLRKVAREPHPKGLTPSDFYIQPEKELDNQSRI